MQNLSSQVDRLHVQQQFDEDADALVETSSQAPAPTGKQGNSRPEVRFADMPANEGCSQTEQSQLLLSTELMQLDGKSGNPKLQHMHARGLVDALDVVQQEEALEKGLEVCSCYAL